MTMYWLTFWLILDWHVNWHLVNLLIDIWLICWAKSVAPALDCYTCWPDLLTNSWPTLETLCQDYVKVAIICMGYWPSLRSRWLDIGQVLFFGIFTDQDGVKIHKLAQKQQGQYQASLYGQLGEWARWIKSCGLIAYLNAQDGAILPARDYLPGPARNFPKRYIVNPLLTQLVWSTLVRSFFFVCLWTSTLSQSINK